MTAVANLGSDRLADLFEAWRAEILSVPFPVLVDPDTALALIRGEDVDVPREIVPRQRKS